MCNRRRCCQAPELIDRFGNWLVSDQAFGQYFPLMNPEVATFWGDLLRIAPHYSTAHVLADMRGIPTTSLLARFQRQCLPSPKALLVQVRALYVAYLLASDVCGADTAYALQYSTPQSLSRHLRENFGVTATQARQTWVVADRVTAFLTWAWDTHHPAWADFHPYTGNGQGVVRVPAAASAVLEQMYLRAPGGPYTPTPTLRIA